MSVNAQVLLALENSRHECERQKRLHKAFNIAATAMLSAQDPTAAVSSVAQALRQELGFHTTAYRVEGDALVMAYHTIAPKLVAAIERFSGLDTKQFTLPVARVKVLRDAVNSGIPTFTSTAQVMSEVVGDAGPEGLAARIVSLLGIENLSVLPVCGANEVSWLLVILGDTLEPGDVEAMRVFGHLLHTTLSSVALRQQLEERVRELTRTQQRMVEAQKLEAVGRLAAGIAHDLNNVLTPVLLIADMLRDEPPLKPYLEDLDAIADATLVAAGTTRRMLSFARGHSEALTRLDVRQLIDEARALTERGRQRVSSIVVNAPQDDMHILGDRNELLQVLVNLVLNAQDAVEHSGTITLSAESDGSVVTIRCKDNGAGMSKEVQANACNPFFTTKHDGSGLGLSVAHGVMARHNGKLTIDTEEGRGTTISLIFQRSVAANDTNSERDPDFTLRSMRVLLVEDRAQVADATCRILTGWGHEVSVAASLAEARQQLHWAEFVLSDIDLPDGLGWTLGESGLPVVFYTGRPIDPPANVVVVRKPFTPATLKRAIAQKLETVAAG